MSPIRILLINNQPDFVKRAVDYLRQSTEFRVIATADDGPMGLLEAQVLHLDVILIDLELPQPGSMESIRQLRAAHPGIGIIALAWQANNDLCARALQAGADSFLVKAHLATGLLASIRQVAHWHKH